MTYGPCVYLDAHWHSFAWEVLTPLSPTLSLTSIMQNPTSAGGQDRTDIIQPGQSLAIPQGWFHVSFNDNCSPLDALLVWDATATGGSIFVPQSITSFSTPYTDAAFAGPLPPPAGLWVQNAACLARCGLNATSTSTASALRNKLANAASLVFSGEQVAAADATALLGKGVKQVAQNDAALAAQALAAKVNRTLSG